MQIGRQKTSKALGAGMFPSALIVCLLIVATALPCHAQASAQLNISMSVTSSIKLVFQNNPAVGTNGFCPLSNAGTNNVGLDFGIASATTGDTLPCVNFVTGFGFYLVSSAFDVVVTKANSSSPNYNLSAAISTAPPAGVSWLINGTILNTTFTQFQTNNAYATPTTENLRVLVNNAVGPQTISETINFLATAN